LLTGLVVVTPKAASAQYGDKAVYNSSVPPVPAPSQVWIDASAFWTTAMGNSPDLCKIIRDNILKASYVSLYPNGAVIDARGLYLNPALPPSIGPITCTGTPFANFQQSTSPPPTTILLPATKIPIPQTWVLPNNMKIVGEEQNTVISPQANVTFTVPDMIDMGSLSLCSTPCSGIAVEHLQINTNSNPQLNGIVNNYAGTSSYVNDVTFQGIACAGLVIGEIGGLSSEAANSGPYTNIQFLTPVDNSCSGNPNLSYPLCIDIETQTQGVHGVTCTGAGSSGAPGAAIYVNASNNTVEDVHIEHFWDGVQIGNSSGKIVANVVVSNAAGGEDGIKPPSPIQNIVHICGSVSTGSNEALCRSSGTVQDVSVLQSGYTTPSFPLGATSVQDDATGTSIPVATTFFTGMYILGETISGGYSRFSTSPSATVSTGAQSAAPAWGVGSGQASGTCATPGALYSNTAGGTMTSVYVCTTSGWKPIA